MFYDRDYFIPLKMDSDDYRMQKYVHMIGKNMKFRYEDRMFLCQKDHSIDITEKKAVKRGKYVRKQRKKA